jgi:uncharacterized protein (TIGR02246 family)
MSTAQKNGSSGGVQVGYRAIAKRRGPNLIIGLLVVAVATAVGSMAGSGAGQERLGHHPVAHDARHDAEERAISDNRAAYARAFEAADAKTAAALWTPDGELVEPDGRIIRGRTAIEKDFADFFAENGPVKIRIASDSLRFPTPDVALESGSCQVTRTRDSDSTSAPYSIVHVKKDGKWYLASVRESNGSAAGNGPKLTDLEWLVGRWTAKEGSLTAELNCEWSEGKTSLVRKYKAKAPDGSIQSGFQIIARDPADGAIRAWMFDSDGGLGMETWSKDGDRWVVEADAVTKDDNETASTNLLKKIDQDSYTWRSVERTIDGVSLPDTPEVTVRREKN